MDYRTIPELLADEWQLGITWAENDFAAYEVIASFHHDYEYHLLLKHFTVDGHNIVEAGYGLWFISAHNIVIMTHDYSDAKQPPIVDAAQRVESWRSFCREVYGG